ncbi:hypothetical protein TIFTF001_003962 [Ficus carica]|uniref:Uncharacterized protein n=1 Tax=Ficus carica TaxID=3494 RepID=A0AA87ZHW2_FICCA|nr:hypothetical protein TIFTF001_003962 [Ficus carica]
MLIMMRSNAGTGEWEIQELSTQSSGEQGKSEEIIGVLCEPKRGQSGETTKRSCLQRRAKEVP